MGQGSSSNANSNYDSASEYFAPNDPGPSNWRNMVIVSESAIKRCWHLKSQRTASGQTQMLYRCSQHAKVLPNTLMTGLRHALYSVVNSGKTAWHSVTDVSKTEKQMVTAMQVQDAKVLLNTLITGFKHLLYSMVNFGNTTRQPPSRNPAQPPLPSVGLREDEVRLTIRLLTCGVSCLTLYTQTSENRDPINNYADVFAVLTVCVPTVFGIRCTCAVLACMGIACTHYRPWVTGATADANLLSCLALHVLAIKK